MLVNILMTNQIAFITVKVEISLWLFMLWNFIMNLCITTVLHQTINFITPKSLYAKLQCLYHLLIPSGYIKTTTTNFEQNLKKSFITCRPEQWTLAKFTPGIPRMAQNYIILVLIKTKPTKLHIAHFLPSSSLWQAYDVLIDFPPVYFLPTHVWSSTSCKGCQTTSFTEMKTWGLFSYINNNCQV